MSFALDRRAREANFLSVLFASSGSDVSGIKVTLYSPAIKNNTNLVAACHVVSARYD